MIAQDGQELLIDLGPLHRVRLPTRPGLAKAVVHLATRPATDFLSPFADGASTTPQHLRDVIPPSLAQFQRFDAGVTSPIFFGQTSYQAFMLFSRDTS
jgi:hypothetical protein